MIVRLLGICITYAIFVVKETTPPVKSDKCGELSRK
jgi:hypothetical protein